MEEENQKPPVSPQEAGMEVGFKLGGCFFVAFFWLGYHPFLSILLGAIGGICAGCIVCWWQVTDEPEHSPPEEKRKTLTEQAEFLGEFRRKNGLLRIREPKRFWRPPSAGGMRSKGDEEQRG
jgi:hypothetical protein